MNHNEPTTLPDAIRARLKTLHWTQEKLATVAGISTGALSNLLNGRSVPEVATVERIADALSMARADALALLSAEAGAPAPPPLDAEAAYIARKLSALPDDVRLVAVDAISGVLDAIGQLARRHAYHGGELVDSAALYDVAPQEEARPSDAALVEEIIGELGQLSNEEELVRLLTIAYHHDPEGVREVARIRAARRAAAEGRQ